MTLFQELLSTPATNFPIQPVLFVLALLESFVLGFIVMKVYQRQSLFSTQGQSFQKSLLIMAPLVCLILMLIGSNLALSIGMVGALSIVRFRTVLKDPLDLTFLFLLICVGLGCGTYNFLMTFVGVLLILVSLMFTKTRRPRMAGGTLIVSGDDEKNVMSFAQRLAEEYPDLNQQRLELGPKLTEVTFHVPSEPKAFLSSVSELKKEFGLTQVTYYQHAQDEA